MPRQSDHKSCVKCGDKAEVCAYTGFYFLTRKSRIRLKPAESRVTGSLPARGFCGDCFLRFAERQGWDENVLKKLLRKLKALHLNEPQERR